MGRLARVLLLVVPLLAAAGVQLSSASFTSTARSNPGNSLAANADWIAPTATGSVIAKAAGGAAGAISKSRTYYVYANASDAGNPASGVSSVTADVNLLTTGGSAVPLVAGSYSVAGATYGYRSALQTAKSTLAEGAAAYSLTLTDAAGNARPQTGFGVTVDNAVPTAADVQTTNVVGGLAGKPDVGDVVTVTYSEPIEPVSLLAAWDGLATTVVVRIANGGSGDLLTIRNAANAAQLPLGSINLGRTDYVTATRDFGATATTSKMIQIGNAIAITLGTPSGATGTAAAAGSLAWTPSATATDAAGNPSTATARTETGAADLDF